MSLTTAEEKAIFKAALEQAALGDLQFTLRIAERRYAEYECSDATLAIMREMRARELSLIGVKGTKAMQAESLRLVSRYRASLPGYASAQRPIAILPIGLRKDGQRKWVSHRTVLQQRLRPLSIETVRSMLEPAETPTATAQTPVKRAPKAKAAPAAPAPQTPCPVCAARSVPKPSKRPLSAKSKYGCAVCYRPLTRVSDTVHACESCGATLTLHVQPVETAA